MKVETKPFLSARDKASRPIRPEAGLYTPSRIESVATTQYLAFWDGFGQAS